MKELEAARPSLEAAKIEFATAEEYYKEWISVSMLTTFVTRLEEQLDTVIMGKTSNVEMQKKIRAVSLATRKHLAELKMYLKDPANQPKYLELLATESTNKKALVAALGPHLQVSTKVTGFLQAAVHLVDAELSLHRGRA